MQLTKRQLEIVEIVKKESPIKGEEIATKLSLTRSALRTDFAFLTKSKILNSKQKVGYIYNENFISGFANKTYIYEIMSNPVTIDVDYSVYATILFMFEQDLGSIIIIKEGYLKGIVSRKDLLKIAIGQKELEKIPISMIMTRMPNIIVVEEKETILSAVEKIITHEIDALPVVKKENINGEIKYKVVGRITKTNITKLYYEMNK